MKVAICLRGQLRCFKSAYPIFSERVLKHLDADIFVSTWYNNTLTPEWDGCIRYNDEGSIDEFINLWKPKEIEIERLDEQKLKEISKPITHNIGNRTKLERYIPMLYKIYRCNQLVKQHEISNSKKYDIIITTRSDVGIPVDITEDFIKNRLKSGAFMSDVVRGGLVSDLFNFSEPGVMDTYCNLYNEVEEHWKKGVTVDNETMPEHHMRYHGIQCENLGITINVFRDPQWRQP